VGTKHLDDTMASLAATDVEASSREASAGNLIKICNKLIIQYFRIVEQHKFELQSNSFMGINDNL